MKKITFRELINLMYENKAPKRIEYNTEVSDERRTGMTLSEFMTDRYRNRNDKDNMYGVGVSDAEFRRFVIDYLLGEDWCVTDPIGRTQINEIALYQILEKHSRRYRKEISQRERKIKAFT